METRARKIYKRDTFATLFEAVSHAYDAEAAQKMRQLSGLRLAALFHEYHDIPKGERLHVFNVVLPQVAVYEVLSAHYGQTQALYLIEENYRMQSAKSGEMFQKMLIIPGMKYGFLKMFDLGLKLAFGTKNGFAMDMLSNTRRELRFNMTACPYHKYTQLCGAPELTHIFCDSDLYRYGDLKTVAFERTKTLGKGGDCCDFCLRVK